MIKHDIEIHKNMDEILEEELVKSETPAKKGMGGLKPRKKIKTAQLTNEKDIVWIILLKLIVSLISIDDKIGRIQRSQLLSSNGYWKIN